ncbi:helix-turn-helix domain protein, partial [Actinobacteria bacterium OV450]
MGDAVGDPDRGRNADHQQDAPEADRADGATETTEGAAASFPVQLRRLRVQRGLSLADLARRTHYSKGYLSKIETGAKRVTHDVALRCDRVLEAGGSLLQLVPDPEVPRARAESGPQPGAQSAGECPYRGLAAFTSRDASWFFGRDRVTAALAERVFERIGSGPLVLVGRSGAGKSSLLSAGLVPALRRTGGFPMAGADGWPIVRFTPTAHPLQELLDCTAKVLGGDLGITVRELRERPRRLLEAVHGLADDAGGGGGEG